MRQTAHSGARDVPPPKGLETLADPGVVAALSLFRQHPTLSRADLARLTGWARNTVTDRVDALTGAGLIWAVGDGGTAARGRPAVHYAFAPRRGQLLVADVGASAMRLARCDLAGSVEEFVEREIDIAAGPTPLLADVAAVWRKLRARERELWGVALSVPGPVEHATGRVVNPPIMTGWHDVDVATELTREFGTDVLVENDVNAMALGEAHLADDGGDLLVIKLGTGVGAGIVADGRLLRGAAGAAGDIGHTEADVAGIRRDRPRCRCGRLACLEAYIGGWALVRDARAEGRQVGTAPDFLTLLADGDAVATALVIDAGRILGNSLAVAVSLLNPARVVFCGRIGLHADQVLSGVREKVYARSLPLATRSLIIERSHLGPDGAVLGLAHELAHRILRGLPARMAGTTRSPKWP